MNSKISIILLGTFALIITLNSCHFNSQYIDRIEDKNEAEKVTNIFYEHLKNGNVENTFQLFSKDFLAATDTSAFRGFTTNIQIKLGKMQKIKLDHWNTLIVVGSNPKSDYVMYYLVKYEKDEAKETVNLTKVNGKIKITGYHINSNGLLK